MTTTLPVVQVNDADVQLAVFYGQSAVEWAETFISTLPDAETGRYSMDVSDDQCPLCEATFSREAWEGDIEEGWCCPNCGERDPRLS